MNKNKYIKPSAEVFTLDIAMQILDTSVTTTTAGADVVVGDAGEADGSYSADGKGNDDLWN